MSKAKQEISFGQDTRGNHYIKVDGDEVKLNTASLDQDVRRVIINGVSNILASIACHMDS